MNIRYLPFVIVLIAFAFSCVPNKKVLYLQDEQTDLYGPAPHDSVLRTYDVVQYDYKLQQEDALSVQISSLTPKEYDFFSLGLPRNNQSGSVRNQGALRGYLIDKDGNIEFPVVGKVKMAGYTVFEAEQHIQEIAKEYLEEPMVRVRLLNFRFTVLGQVLREGSINTYNNRVSVMEAIGLAGGLNELADRHNIKIVRQQDNQISVHYIDILSEDFITSPFYYIHPNDVIVVPPLKQRPFRRYFTQNIAIITSTLSLVLLVIGLITK